ncbi:MAG TPA: hypothetical protein VFO10_17640 [Oligoflexus sp.]|uniref:hypothetical protein n=1 Tax=Oligoflexus sp. TaxID=1971216 RepID=UPI002D7EE275|nr:hypothetical protein [Oligoflexus sp.]HET9239086.1 hypothetical protein [Oligoflexus sp.]
MSKIIWIPLLFIALTTKLQAKEFGEGDRIKATIGSSQMEAAYAFTEILVAYGKYGLIGVHLGNQHVVDKLASGALVRIPNSQKAITLGLEAPIIKDRMEENSTTLLCYTTNIRLGLSEWDRKAWDGGGLTSYYFLATETLFSVRVVSDSKKRAGGRPGFIKSMVVGIGIGFRANFVKDDHQPLGNSTVPSSLIYPTYSVNLYF